MHCQLADSSEHVLRMMALEVSGMELRLLVVQMQRLLNTLSTNIPSQVCKRILTVLSMSQQNGD